MATKRIYVFQHVECEALGTFAESLHERGFTAEHIRLFRCDPLPQDWQDAAALIVLGGPMSVNDAERHPYIADEQAVLRSALRSGMPILGVCLGAQLLAAAAGSRVFPGARPEIGWEPISLTMEGRVDPVISPLAQLAAVFHWHGETFDLPPGAMRLAFSALTLNQAFRLGRCAYGLQFHLEVDAPMIVSWLAEYPNDLAPDPDSAKPRIMADTAQYVAPLRHAEHEAMHRFLDLAGAPGRTKRADHG